MVTSEEQSAASPCIMIVEAEVEVGEGSERPVANILDVQVSGGHRPPFLGGGGEGVCVCVCVCVCVFNNIYNTFSTH
jgi:hypothetical protein